MVSSKSHPDLPQLHNLDRKGNTPLKSYEVVPVVQFQNPQSEPAGLAVNRFLA